MDRDDSALATRLRAGEQDALAVVYDRFAPLLFGIARRVTRNAEAAQDVVQDVLLSFWQHPDRFDEDRGTLRAYLGVMAHRRAIDFVRGEVRRADRERRLSGPHEGMPEADTTDRLCHADAIRSALDRLPDEQRELVELAYFGGCTQRELAIRLALPIGTVKSRMRLAHAKLTSALAPFGMEMA